MKTNCFKSVLIAAILIIGNFSIVKAQMFYQNSHLFLGPKTSNWQGTGPDPQLHLGADWSIESFQGGFNVWRPYPVAGFGNYKMFIAANGRVGIGRQPVSYALEVNGQVWTSAGLLITSDGTLKKNIIGISDNKSAYIDRLLKLNAKSYEKQLSTRDANSKAVAQMVEQGKIRQEDASAALADLNKSNPEIYKKEFGFIAQEVREQFPELVEENADGVLAVNYIGLIPLLVESIKDLQNQVAELKNQVAFGKISSRASGETGNEPVSVSGAVLYQNVPNPSSTGTVINCELPEDCTSARLYIYSMSGSQIKNYTMSASSKSVNIAAGEFAAGTYLYTLVVDGQKVDTKKMILTN
ncbi:MAG: T9SS type A sorting domain-containing protein [Tannerellaceae bacterium]|jgi:polyhydroxyalkanoate synthesis regulator phasin|nr:T9SS type A sorting domain-containing protein [Tannerellaceae bacterium]